MSMDVDAFDRRFETLAARLEPDEAAALIQLLDPVEIAAGEVLIAQGSVTDTLYLVWDGELTASVGEADAERDVGVIERGSYLGEVSLLDPGPATASVRSDAGATVAALRHQDLLDYQQTHPAGAAVLLRQIGQTLAARTRSTARQIDDLPASGATVESRLGAGSDAVEVLTSVLGFPSDATPPHESERFAVGQVIAQAGERSRELRVVVDGRVAMRASDGDLLVMGPGSILAPEALFGAVVTADLVAMSAVETVTLRTHVGELLRSDEPALAANLVRAAASQLARELRALLTVLAASPPVAREEQADIAVIGGGPLGLAYAWFVKDRMPEATVRVLERKDAPDYKVGESTLSTTTRLFAHMGLSFPVMRRLFGIKAGIRFWWTGEGDDDVHGHIDATDIEETFQVERRVLETALMKTAAAHGVDIRTGTRVKVSDSDFGAEGSRLTCETEDSTYDLRTRLVTDASGRASVLPRHFGFHRRAPERLGTFNTNTYYAYFRQLDDVDIPHWNEPATRHIVFPQGWCWFITVVSWEGTPQENLEAMIDHLLSLPSGPDESYPSRRELEERFGATSQVITSMGFTVREDTDTAKGLPVDERFHHYVDRYPVFRRILSHYEVAEGLYGKKKPYSAFQRLAYDTEHVAGDGWCAVGDAAMFSNPLFSPGLNLGSGASHEAAADSVRALRSGDLSADAFRGYRHYAERTYASLMGFNDMLYRSFASQETFERALLMFFFHSVGDVVARNDTYDATDPYIWDLLNPAFTRRVDEVRGALRAAEERGDTSEEMVAAVRAITDPYIEERAAAVAALGLDTTVAIREFTATGARSDTRSTARGDYVAQRCGTCSQWYDATLGRCTVCGVSA